MSVIIMKADPLLSDGLAPSPFPLTSHDWDDEKHWLNDEHASALGSRVSSDHLSTGSMSSCLSDHGTSSEDEFKGQRVGDPLSSEYNTDIGAARHESSDLWGEVALESLIAEEQIDMSSTTTSHEQESAQTSFNSQRTLRAESNMTSSNQQQQTIYGHHPSASPLEGMERPLQVPSDSVPIHASTNSAVGAGTQGYLVPVVQRGDQYYYDPEYPITSAASYTFGAAAPVSHNGGGGGDGGQLSAGGSFQQRQQASLGLGGGGGGGAGSRSANDSLSQQNLIPQFSRSYHGLTENGQQEAALFATLGPMSAGGGGGGAFAGSESHQLGYPMTAGLPQQQQYNNDGTRLIIPTHQIQPSRSLESFGSALPTPIHTAAYPRTPCSSKRDGFDPNAHPDHHHYHGQQMLRSAAPEPEVPSAFMMAYQGGCTPQSVVQSRQPPSSSQSRLDDAACRMEMDDEYGELPEYEVERMRNIRANERLLESLGLAQSPSQQQQSSRHVSTLLIFVL